MSVTKVSTSNGVTTLRKNLTNSDPMGMLLMGFFAATGLGLGFGIGLDPTAPLLAAIILGGLFLGGATVVANLLFLEPVNNCIKNRAKMGNRKKLLNAFQWKKVDLGTSIMNLSMGSTLIVGQDPPTYYDTSNKFEHEITTTVVVRPFSSYIIETHTLSDMGIWDEAMKSSLEAYPFKPGYRLSY